MKTMIASLRLSSKLDGRTRERCPDIVFTIEDDEIAAIRADVEEPHIPLPENGVQAVDIHDDALSRVMDEPAWLKEIARVMDVDGELRLTLPASGTLAWLDTMNLYRYFADISKRGNAPDATLPTGWNRHYSPQDMSTLLHDAGFDLVRVHRASYVGEELAFLATMMWRNWLRGERTAEQDAFLRYGHRWPGKRRFPIGTTWSVTGRKRS